MFNGTYARPGLSTQVLTFTDSLCLFQRLTLAREVVPLVCSFGIPYLSTELPRDSLQSLVIEVRPTLRKSQRPSSGNPQEGSSGRGSLSHI